jgi:hypothetical protein
MKISLLKTPIILSLISAFVFSSPSWAEVETLYPVEDTFILGGTRSNEPNSDSPILVVAARTQSTLEHVRKIFLLFEPASNSADVTEASVKLTHHGRGIVANEGDPQMEIELLLYGAPGGDWDQDTLTWESAPFHEHGSYSDEGNPELELLAEVVVDTSSVNEDGVLEFRDPRIAEFIRKSPDRVTFVVTSRAMPNSPGLEFFDNDQTGRPERKPRLVLERK